MDSSWGLLFEIELKSEKKSITFRVLVCFPWEWGQSGDKTVNSFWFSLMSLVCSVQFSSVQSYVFWSPIEKVFFLFIMLYRWFQDVQSKEEYDGEWWHGDMQNDVDTVYFLGCWKPNSDLYVSVYHVFIYLSHFGPKRLFQIVDSDPRDCLCTAGNPGRSVVTNISTSHPNTRPDSQHSGTNKILKG